MSDVHHPLFARFFNRVSGVMERELGPYRDQLLAALSGRVIEVGAGNGANFPHYPPTVQEVVAVEPEPYLRAKAEHAARQAPVPIRVVDGVADALPLESPSFDAAVVSLVLCSVADVGGALAELRRVLRPGGELRVLEHVRADHQRKARVQQVLDRSGIWPGLFGGCHCSRATAEAIEAAGYTFDEVRDETIGPAWMITSRHVLGTARAPG